MEQGVESGSSLVEIDGKTVYSRPSRDTINVWEIFDASGVFGTLAESHPYRPLPAPAFVARRVGSDRPSIVSGWVEAIRYLVGDEV